MPLLRTTARSRKGKEIRAMLTAATIRKIIREEIAIAFKEARQSADAAEAARRNTSKNVAMRRRRGGKGGLRPWER